MKNSGVVQKATNTVFADNINRSLHRNKGLHICPIGYTQVFYNAKHSDIMKMQIDEKDVRLIKNIQWKQYIAIKMDKN